MDGGVYALALDERGHLYAGGIFKSAGMVDAKNIAGWDGAAWHNLGKGINYRVSTLTFDGYGNLFAGGNFHKAGGKPSNYIARWWNIVARDDSYQIPSGTTLYVATPGVLSNDSDADGDPLSAALEMNPASGSLEFHPDGSFIYVPEPEYTGVVTFQYKVSDDYGSSDRAEVTIEVNLSIPLYLPMNLKN